MRHTLLTLALILCLPAAFAADAERGKTFHDDQCTHCHESMFGDTYLIFTRPDRKMTSFKKLRAMVDFCNTQVNSQFFDDELDDITEYLNQNFYKFPKPE
jgi:hypothetical protein